MHISLRVVVVSDECAHNNLLSRSGAVQLRLIERLDAAADDVFGECGKLKCPPDKIVLKDGAVPYCITAPRRLPFPLLPAVEQELKRLTELGIITPVTKPTDWCSPMVPVIKKTGKFRICSDLTHSVKRERYILPILDDILPALKGATVFSTLDSAGAFNQLELDEDSSDLTTFITPIGRFKYRRVCFGISSASEIFQREMTRVLQGVKGAVALMDDVLVFGVDQTSHDLALKETLQRIKESGLQLNR